MPELPEENNDRADKIDYYVTGILRDLIDPDDCRYDHHGYCQAHGWLDARECPHARGKKWLANLEQLINNYEPDKLLPH